MDNLKSIIALIIIVVILFWILKLAFKSMGLIIRLGITVAVAIFLIIVLKNFLS